VQLQAQVNQEKLAEEKKSGQGNELHEQNSGKPNQVSKKRHLHSVKKEKALERNEQTSQHFRGLITAHEGKGVGKHVVRYRAEYLKVEFCKEHS